MRILGAKLRAFALLYLIATIGGCAADNGKGVAGSFELTLIGRVLSMAEVGVFEGDVEVVWYSYIVEPQGQRGSRVVVVGDRSDCPVAGDNNSIYNLLLQHRMTKFAIRHKADEALISQLFIATCEKLPKQGAHASQ